MLERSSLSTVAASKSGWLYSLSGVIFAAGLYSLIHIAARMFASLNLGEDDPLDAILTQTLQLGYLPHQPPLYDWAIWALGEIFGPGAFRFQFLKYALLTATCGFIFLAARRVMNGDAFWAFLCVEGLALIYQISWRFHEGFTHAVGAMCAVAAAFWALLRLIERRGPGDFALFGAIAGLGVLTVTTFWVFLAALLAAAFLQPAIRRIIASRHLLLALAAMTAIAGPHFFWLAGTPDGIGAILPDLTMTTSADHWRLVLAGLRRAFTEPMMYLAPLIFILPIFFPGMLREIRTHAQLKPRSDAVPDLEQLILHLSLLNVLALIVGTLFFGIHRYATHALMPLFLVTSIWLTAQARNASPPSGQIRRFVIMAVGVAIFAFLGRAANMYVQHPVCNICRWGIPYDQLASAIEARGFAGGQILVDDRELGGNLVRFFPEDRIILSGSDVYVPPRRTGHSGALQTAIVWPADQTLERTAVHLNQTFPNLTPQQLDTAATLTFPWGGKNWLIDESPNASWRLLILDGDGVMSAPRSAQD